MEPEPTWHEVEMVLKRISNKSAGTDCNAIEMWKAEEEEGVTLNWRLHVKI